MISRVAREVVGPDFVLGLTAADVYPPLRPVLAGGWVTVEGAVLLARLLDSYHGERSRFPTLTDYEYAVNGRAIPDLDIDAAGADRIRTLLVRGTAFAWAALFEAHSSHPGIPLRSLITVSPTLEDPSDFTGNMTFYVDRPGDVYTPMGGILVALTSADCVTPLPDPRSAM